MHTTISISLYIPDRKKRKKRVPMNIDIYVVDGERLSTAMLGWDV